MFALKLNAQPQMPPQWGIPEKPFTLRQRLFDLVDSMHIVGASDIMTLDGLLIECFADRPGEYAMRCGMVLSHLMYWYVRMKRYYVWKPDSDWEGHLRLSYYKMSKVRDYLNPIVHTKAKQAPAKSSGWKVPQTFYTLDVHQLVKRIAEVYGKSLTFIRSLLLDAPAPALPADTDTASKDEDEKLKNPKLSILEPRVENPFFKSTLQKPLTTPSIQLDSGEPSSKTVTTQTTQTGAQARGAVVVDSNSFLQDENPQKEIVQLPPRQDAHAPEDGEVVDYLVSKGVWRSKARSFDWIPLPVAESIVAQADKKAEAGTLRETRGAYIFGALQKHGTYIRDELKRHLAHAPNDVMTLAEFAQQECERNQPQSEPESSDTLNWSDFAESGMSDHPHLFETPEEFASPDTISLDEQKRYGFLKPYRDLTAEDNPADWQPAEEGITTDIEISADALETILANFESIGDSTP